MAGNIKVKSVLPDVITGTTQNLYLGGVVGDGSDAKLTIAGSTGTVEIPSLTVASKPIVNSLLAEYTVTGSAVTSIDFSGLDINTHKSYRVEFDLINSTASNSDIYMFVNGDTTNTNYYAQQTYCSGTSIGAGRQNTAVVFGLAASTQSSGVCKVFKRSSGYMGSITNIVHKSGSVVEFILYAMSKSATVTNITQLTFTSAVASAIAVGSTIRIYRGDV